MTLVRHGIRCSAGVPPAGPCQITPAYRRDMQGRVARRDASATWHRQGCLCIYFCATAKVTVLEDVPPVVTATGTELPAGAFAGTCAFTWYNPT